MRETQQATQNPPHDDPPQAHVLFQARRAFGPMCGVLGRETRRCSLLYWLYTHHWHDDRKCNAFYLPRMHSNVAWQKLMPDHQDFDDFHVINSWLASYEVGLSTSLKYFFWQYYLKSLKFKFNGSMFDLKSSQVRWERVAEWWQQRPPIDGATCLWTLFEMSLSLGAHESLKLTMLRSNGRTFSSLNFETLIRATRTQFA